MQVRASRFSSGFGAKVACAELPFAFVSSEKAGGLGGTCVLRGCVPKKLFMYCGEYAEFMRDAEGFGCECSTTQQSMQFDTHSCNEIINNDLCLRFLGYGLSQVCV